MSWGLPRSPQAKGRVERAFGTLQERLTVELRLAGACSLEEANEVLERFIERYNQRFAVPPESSASAFRPVPAHLRLEHVFCWKERRVLNPGYTIQYQKQTYRVVNTKGVPVIPLRTVVEVHRLADGSLFVGWNGHIYPLEPVPASSLSPKNKEAGKKGGQSMGRKPAPDHPWRRPWKSSQINHGVSF
ncbi:integrase core domain-containing protein [Desulfofundulus salinum]|uniref:integrase core domain-containing protein n=1 Tax=Desulfofundulus salinus TaxID=2419843 RepID=UPI001A9AD3D4